MPFITEEIWQAIPHAGKFLISAEWPVYREEFAFGAEEAAMEQIIEAITALRARRAEMNVPMSKKVNLTIAASQPEVFEAGKAFFLRLAGAEDVKVCGMEAAEAASGDDGLVEVTTHAARLFMPLAELVDFEKELI